MFGFPLFFVREDSFIVSHNESWLTAVNNTNWELIDVTWSNEQSVIDSLLSARCIFDGQSADTTGDIWYSSGMSSFSGLTTLRDEAMQIFTSDHFHDRILALNMRRSHLIRLSSGQEIWTHDLVFGHTVSGYGTGAGTVNKPVCIDSDYNGNLYYGQTGDFFQIHKIQPVLGGTYPVYPSVFQPGINDIMDLYRFESPRDVTVDNHQSVYVANTMTAFILMNIMASKIHLSNVTKFKIGIGCTTFVFVGLSIVTEWWMAMPFMALVGATWAFLFIGGNFHLMENNPRSTSTGIFSSTLSIATVIGPVVAGTIAFVFDYVSVMYFAIGIIVIAFIVSLKIKD